jgi:lipopolysaccharide export system protein LptC
VTTTSRNTERAYAEALGTAPLARNASRDWTARTRATARQAERYSRFVVIMKRALPLAAAALVAAVLVYALQPRQQSRDRVAMTFQRLGIVNNDLAMLKPRLTGVDSEGDPYVVTADEAIQDRRDAKRARLENVQGDATMKDGSWMGATATGGVLDGTAHRLDLRGAVALYSDGGYELHTTAATVSMRNGIVTGDQFVNGQGPLGTFRADRFRVMRATKMVFLYGNVHMTFYGHGPKQG